MFNKTVTVYNRSLTPEGVKWEKRELKSGHTLIRKRIDLTASRDNGDNYGVVRILTSEPVCRAGDMIRVGTSPSPVPDSECFVITGVTENFTGTRRMHHVKINIE